MKVKPLSLAILSFSAFSVISLIGLAQAALAQAPTGGEAKPAATPAATPGATEAPKKPKHPPLAVEHYNRGVEFHKAGALNKAILEYREAIKVDEHMERAYSNLGLIYTSQKSWTKALEAFDKALEMKGDRTTSLNGLGTVLYAMKRVDEAMEKWRKAVEIDPTFASAYYNMGNAYENEKKNKEALGAYVKAVEVNPKMGDAYYRIGTLLNANGKHGAQAFLLLNKAIKMEPDAEFVRDARKQISTLDKQFKEGTEGGGEAGTNSASATPAAGDRKVADSTKSPSADDRKNPGQMLKSLFKRGDKVESKNVNMFVQPPTADGDLKAKPKQ